MRPTEPHTVLVTDAARGSALAIVRSLGRAGMRIVAADSDLGAPAMRSRWVAAARVYPRPSDSVADLCDALFTIVQEERVDLVIPVTDLVLQPLASQRARFASTTLLALPDDVGLATTSDKLATLELAGRLGVPTPDTRLVCNATEARAAALELGWPLVLKPRASKRVGSAVESFEVEYVASEAELTTRLHDLDVRSPVLLQRWVPGIGYGVEMLLSEGRPLAAFQHRRLREVPVTGGASSYRESMALDPVLYDHASRLLGALRWTGLAMVEFRVGPAGAHLMEINGRVWGSLPLAVAAGVDFPLLLTQLLLEGETAVSPRQLGAYRIGLRARDLQRDMAWIGNVLAARRRHAALPFPPRRAALGALAGFFDPRTRTDAWAWDDPRPAVADLGQALRRAWNEGLNSAQHGRSHGAVPLGSL